MKCYRIDNLQYMCLNVIIHDFEYHYLQYENTLENKYFLQSKFSTKIYAILKRKNMTSIENLTWLLSPFWTDLTIPYTHVLSAYIPQLKLNGRVIKSISLENSTAEIPVLSKIICLIPNVESINLDFTNCNDDLLLLIRKKCLQIKNLSLVKCNINNAGIMRNCYMNRVKVDFKSLQKLNLSKTLVSLKGIKYILKNLKLHVLISPHLQKAISSIHKQSKNKVNILEIKNLEFINQKLRLNFNETLNCWMDTCPNAEKILIVNILSNDHFEKLSKFQKLKALKYVNVEFDSQPSSGLDKFLAIRGEFLSELCLTQASVSIDIIMKYCLNLTLLSLTRIKFYDTNETPLAKRHYILPKLAELKIYYAQLDERPTLRTIHILLTSCPALETLVLENVRYFPHCFFSSITKMALLSKVEFIFLDSCPITDKLFACQNLKLLSVNEYPVRKRINYSSCDESISVKGNTLSWQPNYSHQANL